MKKRKVRPTADDVIRSLNLTRRNNLRNLIGPGKRFAQQVELASALGVTDSYLSQMLGPKPIRRVTETTARKFEYQLGLRNGALDVAGVGDV